MTGPPEGERLPEVHSPPPAARSRGLAERLRAVESRNVTMVTPDFPVFWEEARGSNVVDADGNRYVDLTAGFGVAAVGHGHPRVVEAVRRQAGRLLHGMGDVHPPAPKVELLERLAGLVPHGDPRIALGVSGSEAVETALKTATLATGRPGIVAFTGGYHGLTYGALSVTDRAHFRDPFREQLNPHVLRAGYPHPYRPPRREGFPGPGAPPEEMSRAALEEVRALLETGAGGGVGAVIVEPAQGRGGEVIPPAGFLGDLATLCRERGILLVADEIYTGFGRTGRRFACGAEGVVPDLLCVGKGMSGGMPISACVGERELIDAWPPSEGEAVHTSTFLGHPLSCAAAVAALGVLEDEGLAARARELGARWRRELEEMAEGHGAVGQVRGRGLMVGLDLVEDPGSRGPDGELAGRVVVEALRRGWILLAGGPAGNVISLSPPLTVTWRTLEAATAMLDEVLEAEAPPG